MLQVQLKPGLPDGKWAFLRPLCGYDETIIDGANGAEAIGFLDRMLIKTTGTSVGPGKASALAIGDCSRLFAALYQHYFGERIDSTATCQKCNEVFELSFSLLDLMNELGDGTTEKAAGPDKEGIYTLTDGRRFRLPTAGDLNNVMQFEPEEAVAMLLNRCVVEGDSSVDTESIQMAMDEVGANLDLDLNTVCPECDSSQTVRFDIQSYLLRALEYEKRFLNHEVHRIAMAYGWKYEEILSLTREDRRTFVRLIEAERVLGQRRIRA